MSFLLRHRVAVLLFFLASYPLILWASLRAFQGGSTSAEEWLPESFSETLDLRWFQKHFVSDDMFIISWDGCTLDDPRVAQLAALLRSPIETGDGSWHVLTRHVLTPQEMIEQLKKNDGIEATG